MPETICDETYFELTKRAEEVEARIEAHWSRSVPASWDAARRELEVERHLESELAGLEESIERHIGRRAAEFIDGLLEPHDAMQVLHVVIHRCLSDSPGDPIDPGDVILRTETESCSVWDFDTRGPGTHASELIVGFFQFAELRCFNDISDRYVVYELPLIRD